MGITERKYFVTVLAIFLSSFLWSSPLASEQEERWGMSAEPVVEIGVVEGDPDYMFASVVAARLLPDGRIAVADGGDASVRVYGPGGGFRTEMGGEGEGPGEFRSVFGMWVVPPDTLRVWDPGLVRITTFLADGSLVATRKVQSDPAEGPGGVLDVAAGGFGNGDVALGWTVGQPRRADELVADRTVFGRFGPDGHLKHLLGEGEGLHRYDGAPVPFSPYPYAAVIRDSLYFTNGVGGRIAVFDPEGSGVARTIEIAASGVDASEAWPALRAEADSSVLARTPPPRLEHTPALGGLLADPEGYLWVKLYDPASDAVPLSLRWGGGGEWRVITPEGETVTDVEIPDGTIPLDVRGDRLLGLRRGPLDVDRVVVHRIER